MTSLKPYSTFRIDAQAKHIVTIHSLEDLHNIRVSEVFQNTPKRLIVGGGSNIVFTQDFDGLIIHNQITGRHIVRELNNSIIISLGSGENRHDMVMRSVAQGYVGIENLVSIPGTVGAAPVQNIGAYGTEVRDVILEVQGIDLTTGKAKTYTNEQCQFGYRTSIFKETLGQEFFITAVVVQLKKANERLYHPNLSYQGIQEQLLSQGRDGGSYISPLQMANAISTIRASKLPDRTKIGTCGSFFANPIIPASQYKTLKKSFPGLVGHIVSQGFSPLIKGRPEGSTPGVSRGDLSGVEGSLLSKKVKLSAGQLIELCGLKGYRDGDAGVYDRHALVLVNYGTATGSQITSLITMIQSAVQAKFGISIIPEVNVM